MRGNSLVDSRSLDGLPGEVRGLAPAKQPAGEGSGYRSADSENEDVAEPGSDIRVGPGCDAPRFGSYAGQPGEGKGWSMRTAWSGVVNGAK